MSKKLLFFLFPKIWKEVKFINYFFEVVLPQLLDYFKENNELVKNYFLLEILKKDKKYQEQIKKIFEENKQNKTGE